MSADDLIALNEQIAAMARAGLPLDQGLGKLGPRYGRGSLRTINKEIAATFATAIHFRRHWPDSKGGFPLLLQFGDGWRAHGTVAGSTHYLYGLCPHRQGDAAYRYRGHDLPGDCTLVGFNLFLALIFFILPQIRQDF